MATLRSKYSLPQPTRRPWTLPSRFRYDNNPVRRFATNNPATGYGNILGPMDPGLVITGAFSVAVLCRPRTTAADTWAEWNGAFNQSIRLLSSNTGPRLISTTGAYDQTCAIPYSIGQWMIIGVSKAAGTVLPRGHVYKNGAWTHADFPTTCQDTGASGLTIMFFNDAVIASIDGDQALAGVWVDRVLTDADYAGLTANMQTSDWLSTSVGAPSGLWQWNQTDPLAPAADVSGRYGQSVSIVGAPTIVYDGPNWNYDLVEQWPAPELITPQVAVA